MKITSLSPKTVFIFPNESKRKDQNDILDHVLRMKRNKETKLEQLLFV